MRVQRELKRGRDHHIQCSARHLLPPPIALYRLWMYATQDWRMAWHLLFCDHGPNDLGSIHFHEG